MHPALHSRRSVLATGGLLGVAALAGCTGFDGVTATGEVNHTTALRGAERLVVENPNGDMVVEPDTDLTEHVAVEATLGDGGHRITASSGNGDVELYALD